MEISKIYDEILAVLGGNVDKHLTVNEARKINEISKKYGFSKKIARCWDVLLIFACERDDYEFTKYLLDHGANPNINIDFEFPLRIAAAKGFVDIVDLLLQYNVNINMQNMITDDVALHIACRHNKIDIVKILLSQNTGANVNIEDDFRNTPIHLASMWTSDPQIFDLLYLNGANIEARNIQGDTPLILACRYKNYDGVLRLISYGCDLDTQNNDRYTALMVAILKGHTEIVQILQKYTCNDNITDDVGETPLNLIKY